MTDRGPTGQEGASASATTQPPPPLNSLVRKAAVDAGFDLEPEIDGVWWRLRASGAPGVAWVHPTEGGGALLALPSAPPLSEIGAGAGATAPPQLAALPPGAAGAIGLASPQALHQALRRVWTLRAHAPERLRERWEAQVAVALEPATGAVAVPSLTEVLAEVRRRVGQDLFREALLDYWDGRCAVTRLATPELLRASHAKPWAVASDAERLDVHNGLLLAVHLDALFDRGLLTFDDKGHGILSGRLPNEAKRAFGLSGLQLRLPRIAPQHLPFLRYHRDQVFRP